MLSELQVADAGAVRPSHARAQERGKVGEEREGDPVGLIRETHENAARPHGHLGACAWLYTRDANPLGRG